MYALILAGSDSDSNQMYACEHRVLSVHAHLAGAMAYRRALVLAAPATRWETSAFEMLQVVELFCPVEIGDAVRETDVRRRWPGVPERSTA
jgi:hypothetical protein